MKNKGVIVAVVVTVGIAIGLTYYYLKFRDIRGQVVLKSQVSNVKLPDVPEQPLTPGSRKSQASTVLQVNNPTAVAELLKQNAWLTDVLASPLGRGFGAGWSAFLQTKGEDLKARFTGPVFDYLFQQAFSKPFAIAWVSDSEATGSPAFIAPSNVAVFETMTALAGRGVVTANNCPGEDPGKEVKFKILRWLVADQALYAGLTSDRFVVAQKPTAVLQGLCMETPKPGKAAIDLVVYPERFGRESQLFGVLLGTQGEVHLPIEVEAGRLVPKGITAPLTKTHLAVAAASDELLKLIPDDMPVSVVLQLKLPKTLNAQSLAAFFKDGSGELQERQVALLWDPRASNDVAMVWSRASEKDALHALFSGRQASFRVACGQVLMASNSAFGDRVERTCKGQSPSRLNAQPEVAQGARAAQSVALHLHLGALLSSLMIEQFKAEKHSAPIPPEIEQAKKQLEALPFFGFVGRVDGSTLVGEGFRS